MLAHVSIKKETGCFKLCNIASGDYYGDINNTLHSLRIIVLPFPMGIIIAYFGNHWNHSYPSSVMERDRGFFHCSHIDTLH